MNNIKIDAETLPIFRKVLSDSKRWRVFSSLLPPDSHPIDERRKRQINEYNDSKWLIHSHLHREVLFCLKGTAPCIIWRDQVFPCIPGTLLLADSNEKHGWTYPEGDPGGVNAIHLWLHFVQNKISGTLISESKDHIHRIKQNFIADDPELYRMVMREWDALKHSPLDNCIKKKLLLSVFTLLLTKLYELALIKKGYTETVQDRQTQIINIIKEHIRDTAGCGLTVDKLARIAGYSKFYFLRIFKIKTGSTVHVYINEARVNKTAEMEAKGILQKEIAGVLGFSSPSAFSQWRKKQAL